MKRSRFFTEATGLRSGKVGRKDDNNDEEEVEVKLCSICLLSVRAGDRAIPNGCQHEFCFECINTWGRVGKGATSSCPMCKAPFTFITYTDAAGRRLSHTITRTTTTSAEDEDEYSSQSQSGSSNSDEYEGEYECELEYGGACIGGGGEDLRPPLIDLTLTGTRPLPLPRHNPVPGSFTRLDQDQDQDQDPLHGYEADGGFIVTDDVGIYGEGERGVEGEGMFRDALPEDEDEDDDELIRIRRRRRRRRLRRVGRDRDRDRDRDRGERGGGGDSSPVPTAARPPPGFSFESFYFVEEEEEKEEKEG